MDEHLQAVVSRQPFPLLFVTISGAHLYGFPSPDSDYDLRGVHILPLDQVVGLKEVQETLESPEVRNGLQIDLVTHDARKFFEMLLKRNGYVLEQLHSPLILYTSPEHDELKILARDCITRFHAHHYLGFSKNQWEMFDNERPRRVKPLLYVFRVLLTGIHLMQTGEIEANLLKLNERFKLPYVPDLVARKLAGGEQSALVDTDATVYYVEYQRLRADLETARDNTSLPDVLQCRDALHDLLVRLRLKHPERRSGAAI